MWCTWQCPVGHHTTVSVDGAKEEGGSSQEGSLETWETGRSTEDGVVWGTMESANTAIRELSLAVEGQRTLLREKQILLVLLRKNKPPTHYSSTRTETAHSPPFFFCMHNTGTKSIGLPCLPCSLLRDNPTPGRLMEKTFP